MFLIYYLHFNASFPLDLSFTIKWTQHRKQFYEQPQNNTAHVLAGVATKVALAVPEYTLHYTTHHTHSFILKVQFSKCFSNINTHFTHVLKTFVTLNTHSHNHSYICMYTGENNFELVSVENTHSTHGKLLLLLART